MDGGAWWAADHGVARSWTQLSNFTFTFQFHALEKEMATHSSVLARAWWAAVYGVAQSWTRLRRLSSSSSIKRVLIIPYPFLQYLVLIISLIFTIPMHMHWYFIDLHFQTTEVVEHLFV